MKHCRNPNCEQVNPQPLDNFHKGPSYKNGLRSRCKKCINKNNVIYNKSYYKNHPVSKENRRQYDLKCRYNLTINQYNQLFEEQKGCCSICNKHQSELKTILNVDHDHKTGEVRGLLCTPCNRGVGFFQDSCDLLNKAQSYLNKPKLKIVKESV